MGTSTTRWQAIAGSADGRKIFMVGPTNLIYFSVDFGASWQSNAVPGDTAWTGIACSADGSKLFGVAYRVGVFVSTNSGISWALDANQFIAQFYNENPIGNQASIIASADGAKLVLFPGMIFDKYFFVPNDVIWLSYSTPAPRPTLSTFNTNLALSWIEPATNFVLQQNLDLTTTNWKPVTNAAVLDLSNLQYEVSFLPTNSSGFFRLTTP